MAESGLYEPISVEEAVSRSARVLEKFIDAGVDVIRIGLCSSENLASPDTYYGGPNHAALGELVINELFYNRFSEALLKLGDISESRIKITVAKGAISKVVGQKRINKERLIDRFSLKELTFRESTELSDYDFFVDITERKKRCI
jgi:histone acetyltransferase (RNA polymerase elongator complex component)